MENKKTSRGWFFGSRARGCTLIRWWWVRTSVQFPGGKCLIADAPAYGQLRNASGACRVGCCHRIFPHTSVPLASPTAVRITPQHFQERLCRTRWATFPLLPMNSSWRRCERPSCAVRPSMDLALRYGHSSAWALSSSACMECASARHAAARRFLKYARNIRWLDRCRTQISGRQCDSMYGICKAAGLIKA